MNSSWVSTAAVTSLVLLLIAHIALIYIAIKRATRLKLWLQEFPTHAATVVVALILIFYTGVVIVGRIALGKPSNDNSDWLLFLGSLAGIVTGGLGIKRFSSPEYQQSKQPHSVVNAGGVDRMDVQVNQASEAVK